MRVSARTKKISSFVFASAFPFNGSISHHFVGKFQIKCKWMLQFSSSFSFTLASIWTKEHCASPVRHLCAEQINCERCIWWTLPHSHCERFSSLGIISFISLFIWQLVFNGRLNNDVQYWVRVISNISSIRFYFLIRSFVRSFARHFIRSIRWQHHNINDCI